MSRITREEVFTIPSGSDTSNEVDLKGGVFLMLDFPATLTGTTFTPQIKVNGASSFKDVFNSADDTQITFDKVAGCKRLSDGLFPSGKLRIVSDQTEAAERVFYAITGD